MFADGKNNLVSFFITYAHLGISEEVYDEKCSISIVKNSKFSEFHSFSVDDFRNEVFEMNSKAGR